MLVDAAQLFAILAGAGSVIGTLSITIYRMLNARITALETENATLRTEAKEAVKAKDAEITTLRDIAAKLAEERSKELDVGRNAT